MNASADTNATNGVGAKFVAARTARNLSIADIARQLKFSPWQIEALESENYELLPDAVFTRGFIRNYARLVGIDPAPLLAAADPHLPHHSRPPAELPPSADIPFRTRPPVKWHRYAIAVVVLTVPIILFEMFRDDSDVTIKVHSPPALQSSTTPAVAASATANEPPLTHSKLAPTPVSAANAAEGESTYHLTFVFDRESWVEVRDGHGQRLMWQLNPAGSRQTLDGVPPLSLVVGNAGNVHLQLNNQPVDLVPHTEIDVARLTLE